MRLFGLIFIYLILFSTVNAQDVQYQSTQPGPIIFTVHDPLTVVSTNAMFFQLSNYVYLNSYGRNTLECRETNDCAVFGSGVAAWTDPNLIDYTVNCAPMFGTWDFYTTMHESMHTMKISEGYASNSITGYWDAYGDQYSVMSRQGAEGAIPAPYKEHIGWLGSPDSLRTILTITNNQTIYITDIESQSDGAKAFKVLLSEFIIYRSDMKVYSDKKTYLYFEMRKNHSYLISGGKGKKRYSYYSQMPAVQVRQCTPNYLGQGNGYENNVVSILRLDIGSNGGLNLNQTYSFVQDISSQVTYNGAINHSVKSVSIKIIGLDTNGATVQISFL